MILCYAAPKWRREKGRKEVEWGTERKDLLLINLFFQVHSQESLTPQGDKGGKHVDKKKKEKKARETEMDNFVVEKVDKMEVNTAAGRFNVDLWMFGVFYCILMLKTKIELWKEFLGFWKKGKFHVLPNIKG